MKKGIIILIVLGILIVIGLGIGGYAKNFYNSAIKMEEPIEQAWGNVESAYQRRSDLIGNLVKTVQGAADFERTTLREVIEARAKATSTQIDASSLTPEKLQAFNEAQTGLSGALSRLLVAVERYPELKANQNFLSLQSQLEGTENRINVARDRYNEQVRPYNEHIRTFPNNILAGWFDMQKKTYFEAETGAEKAPDVDFKFD